MHEPILETLDLNWPDEAACETTARALAGHPGLLDALISLQGPLGAGKTTFARHLLRALGVQGRIKSPTYAVLESYEVACGGDRGDPASDPARISHFDFYRFANPREWEDAGFRDVFAAPGLKLCEWPDKAAGLLPAPDLKITIDPSGLPSGLDGHTPTEAPTDPSTDPSTDPPQEDRRRAVRLQALTPLGLHLLRMLQAAHHGNRP